MRSDLDPTEQASQPLLAAHWIRVEAIARGRAWLVANPPWPADALAAELVEASAAALTR